MTRNGKIARLPHGTRSRLNERLRDGEEGKEIVKWLNGCWIVQDMLKEKFGGRPISEQNLSEWKQGGYQDWLRHQETRAVAREFLDEAEELEEEVGDTPLTDRLTETVALALAQLLRETLNTSETGSKQRTAILEIVREFHRLRSGDHEMERIRMETERWQIETEQREEEEQKRDLQKMKGRLTAPIWAAATRPIVAQAFGGGEKGERVADFLSRVEAMDPDHPESLHWEPPPPPTGAAKPSSNPGESN